eukprot:Nk52_evm8s365 gene=Nk52_evmTU8s365
MQIRFITALQLAVVCGVLFLFQASSAHASVNEEVSAVIGDKYVTDKIDHNNGWDSNTQVTGSAKSRWERAYNRYINLSKFDPTTAQTLGYYSYVPSYSCNDTSLEEFNCPMCKYLTKGRFIDLIHDEFMQTVAMVFVDESLGGIVVSYRATWSTLNWLENVDFLTTPLKGKWGFPVDFWRKIRVHWGFYYAIKNKLQKQLYPIVNNLRKDNPNYKLYVTGISMGAAQASLASIDFVLNGVKVDGVYTYGSPRVGNHAFVQYYMEKMTCTQHRVTDHGDNVPYLPATWMGNYLHVPHEVYLETIDVNKNEFRYKTDCNDKFGEAKECHNSVPYSKCSWVDHVEYLIRFPKSNFRQMPTGVKCTHRH